MTKKKFFYIICLVLICVSPVFAGGKKEKENASSNSEIKFTLNPSKEKNTEITGEARLITVTGTIRLVGTGLFNDLVISGENEWYIAKDDREKLHQYQQQTVTVEGEETVREMKFANGMSAGIRRELRNIRIISIN